MSIPAFIEQTVPLEFQIRRTIDYGKVTGVVLPLFTQGSPCGKSALPVAEITGTGGRPTYAHVADLSIGDLRPVFVYDLDFVPGKGFSALEEAPVC